MSSRRAAVLMLVASMVAFGGVASAQAATEPPEGVPWMLRELTIDGALTDVPEGMEASLLMAAGQASGSAGCNSWSGAYTIEGDALTFDTLMSTAMLCPEPQMTVESAYLDGLGRVATYVLDRNGLTMLDGRGEPVLGFDGTDAAPIAGGWVVASYRGGDGDLVETLPGSLLTAVFGADGALEGSSGCNHYSAWFTIERDDLRIGPLSTTAMACASPELQAQESAFLAALAASNRWSEDGVLLDLVNASGVGKDTTVKLAAATDAAYIGSWTVTGFALGDGSVVAPMDGSSLGARFAADGTVEGSSGCNAYAGPYTVRGPAMTIGPLATTLAICDSGIDTQEQQYLAALQTVTAWATDGSGIVLRGPEGVTKVTLEPAL